MGRPVSYSDSSYLSAVRGGILPDDQVWVVTSPYLTVRASGSKHLGVDLARATGELTFRQPTIAPFSATVGRVVLNDAVFGNAVALDVDGGGSLFVMHLDEVWVRAGDRVQEGQTFGLCGWTGQVYDWQGNRNVNASHFHLQAWTGPAHELVDHAFEERYTVDPLAYLALVAARSADPPQPPPAVVPLRSPALLKALQAQGLARALAAGGIDGLQALSGVIDELVTTLEAQEA